MRSPFKDKSSVAYLYAVLAIIFWSTVSTAFKLSLRYQTPTQLLLGATFVSTVVVWIIILFQKKQNLIMQGSRKDLVRSVILGFLNPFLYYIVLLEAYIRLPAQEAQALNYIWVVMLTLLSIPILKQKPVFRDISGVLISFCGAVVIAFRGDFSRMQFAEPTGVSLALISTLLWAISWLFNVKDKRENTIKLFWIFAFGFFFTLIYSICTSQFVMPGIYALEGEAYIGLFEMGITFLVWLMALQEAANTAKVTNLIFITPFISLAIIHLVLGEAITVSTLAGLVLIIGGILWQQTGKKEKTISEN